VRRLRRCVGFVGAAMGCRLMGCNDMNVGLKCDEDVGLRCNKDVGFRCDSDVGLKMVRRFEDAGLCLRQGLEMRQMDVGLCLREGLMRF